MTLEVEAQRELKLKVNALRLRWNTLCPHMVTMLLDETPRSSLDLDQEVEQLEEETARVYQALHDIRMVWR